MPFKPTSGTMTPNGRLRTSTGTRPANPSSRGETQDLDTDRAVEAVEPGGRDGDGHCVSARNVRIWGIDRQREIRPRLAERQSVSEVPALQSPDVADANEVVSIGGGHENQM